MDVGSPDLGATRQGDADDVGDVASHELPGDHPAFALCDRRAGPEGGHFSEAVDSKLGYGQIDPGALHEAKAFDPRPRPNELGFHDREIVPHDQKRNPGPFALDRLRKGIVKLLGAGVSASTRAPIGGYASLQCSGIRKATLRHASYIH